MNVSDPFLLWAGPVGGLELSIWRRSVASQFGTRTCIEVRRAAGEPERQGYLALASAEALITPARESTAVIGAVIRCAAGIDPVADLLVAEVRSVVDSAEILNANVGSRHVLPRDSADDAIRLVVSQLYRGDEALDVHYGVESVRRRLTSRPRYLPSARGSGAIEAAANPFFDA